MPKVRYHKTRKVPKFGSIYGRELQSQWSAAAGDAYPGGGSVRPFGGGGSVPKGPAVYDSSATQPGSPWVEVGNPDRYRPLGWGAVDVWDDASDNILPASGNAPIAPKAPPRSAGHGRVGPGKLEADAAKAAAQAAWEASVRRPTTNPPDPHWEDRFADQGPVEPPPHDGEMRRNLIPTGANNMFNGLDPDTAFSGRDPQLETFMHNRFTLGDADREWSRDMPKRHRVYGMDIGWANGSRTQDLDRHKTIGAKAAYVQKRIDDKVAAKVKRGPKGGIRVGQGRVSDWDPVARLGEGISDLSEYTGFGPAMRGIVNYLTPFGKSYFPDERPVHEDRFAYPSSYVPSSGPAKSLDTWGRRWVGTAAASVFTGYTGRTPYQTVDRAGREVGLSLADQVRVATPKERDEYRREQDFLALLFDG